MQDLRKTTRSIWTALAAFAAVAAILAVLSPPDVYGAAKTINIIDNATTGAVRAAASGDAVTVPTGATLEIPEGALTNSTVVSADIKDGEIVSADLSATAAITLSQLAALNRGFVIIGNSSNVAAAVDGNDDGYILIGDGTDLASVDITGDIDISNAGVASISASAIVNADVNASAAIAFTKLAALNRGYVLIGNASNAAAAVDANDDGYILIGDGTDIASVDVTGDIEITNAGVTSISTGVIVNADINASAAIANTKLAPPAIRTISVALAYGDMTNGGGNTAYEDFTDSLPADAFVLGWWVDVTTGFSGDTTAVVAVGTSSDTDLYSEIISNSVAAPGDVGSGPKTDTAGGYFAGSASTPRVTITGSADWDNVSQGAGTAYLYYIATQ